MARLTDDQKQAVLKDIRDHMLIEGPRNWDMLMAKYPDVSRATFWRMIREVREQVESTAGDSPGQIRAMQKRIRARVANPEQTTERIKAHLPVAPSPAVVAADPAGAMKAFDFFAFFDRIVKDAELSRAANVRTAEDGTERIINPAMFDRNIARRLAILETFLHSMEAVYNFERIRELYQVIVEEVGKADPDVQQAVLARLRALNDKRGLTMAARM